MPSGYLLCNATVSHPLADTKNSSMKSFQGARARELAGFLNKVPAVRHAFAYGSGVFTQEGLYGSNNQERPMLDFILAVDDPVAWHDQVEIRLNKLHGLFPVSKI